LTERALLKKLLKKLKECRLSDWFLDPSNVGAIPTTLLDFMIKEYLGQILNKKCDMCKTYNPKTKYFLWVGLITKTRCEICFKCAKREGIFIDYEN
jgi:hypothetical protein